MKIALVPNQYVLDFKDNYFTKWLEQKNNVDLQFELLPETETNTKIALMVAGGDLPDIINQGLSAATILDYGSKGAFIPLDKYFNNAAMLPNFNKIPQADRNVMLQSMTSGDGHIYAFVSHSPETGNMTYNTIYLNMAWIEKLGLKVPTTTDELRQTLIAFRDRDPNGNGKKDEMGIGGRYTGTYGENIIETLINSFIYYPNSSSLTLDSTGKKVIAPFTDPEFRAALQYLNTLYKDGTLSASLFTNNDQQYRAELNNNPPVLGLLGSGSFSLWPAAAENPNYNQLKLVPPFKGPKGVAWSPYRQYNSAPAAYITYKSTKPDVAFRFLESFYDLDTSLVSRFGEENVDWSRSPELIATAGFNAYVDRGVYPSLALVQTETGIWGNPSNKFWRQTVPCYRELKWMDARSSVDRTKPPVASTQPEPYTTYVNPIKAEIYIPAHPQYLLPQLKYTAADSEKVMEPQTNVTGYVDLSVAEFVTGQRDINNNAQWQAYLDELNKMGLQTLLSTSQATFDRASK
ncbi:ABC transporter substrate-binding protein [Spirochaetia bacterium]|nr:ABC transporter substrate-binding protein [Spirochaetia bacterium]